MAIKYASVKKAVIDVVDDFSNLDVFKDYPAKYNAKTKLEKLGISVPVLAVMPPRFNKKLREVAGRAWQPVGPMNLVDKATIGDLILLACGQCGCIVPEGEPT